MGKPQDVSLASRLRITRDLRFIRDLARDAARMSWADGRRRQAKWFRWIERDATTALASLDPAPVQPDDGERHEGSR